MGLILAMKVADPPAGPNPKVVSVSIGPTGDGRFREAYVVVYRWGEPEELYRVVSDLGHRRLVWKAPKKPGSKVRAVLAVSRSAFDSRRSGTTVEAL